MATVSGAASIEITPVHQPGDSQAGGSVLVSCMTTTNRLTQPARNGSATSSRPARPPSPARSPKPNRCLQRMKPPRGGRKAPASVFASVPTGTNHRTPLPPAPSPRRPGFGAQEARKQEASSLVLPFYRRPRSAASTPRRKEGRRAARRCAAPARSLRRAGPLGRKASPRALRNPAPLARRPPVLTHPEGRRSR